jgi:hypothetical protein
MKLITIKFGSISLGILAFFTFNCTKPVPTEDLVKARLSIEEVQKNNLEGKPKELLDKSIEQLKLAHEKLPEEEYDVAKEKASHSYALSRLAMAEWYPGSIENLKKEYQEKIQQAEDANAEVHAKEDFEASKSFFEESTQALNSLEQAKLTEEDKNKLENQKFSSNQEKDQINKKLESNVLGYGVVYDKLKKAIKSATIAYETSLSAKNDYYDQLRSIENQFNDAKKYKIEAYEPEKSALFQQKIEATRNQIENNQLKVAYKNLEELKNEVNQLYQIAIKNYSEEKLNEASKAFEKANKNVGSNQTILGQNKTKINEMINAGNEALNNAKSDFESKNYESSIQNSEEVIKISGIINDLINDSYSAYKRNLALEEQRKKEEELKQQDQNVEQKEKELQEAKDENLKLIYTVKKTKPAECLWRIAGKKEIYRNPYKWKKIYDANKDQIKNPNLIYPGQKLRIPKE